MHRPVSRLLLLTVSHQQNVAPPMGKRQQMMSPERLAEIRTLASKGAPWGYAEIAAIINAASDLLDYVDELTRERDDARRIAIDSGVFQDRGEAYELDEDARDNSWRADPVGPVAWDKQEQQR